MKKIKQLKFNIQADEKIVNRKIREKLTLKKVTVCKKAFRQARIHTGQAEFRIIFIFSGREKAD